MTKRIQISQFVMLLILTLGALSSFGASDDDALTTTKPTTQPNWEFDFYGESYKTITQNIPVFFDRWKITKPRFVHPLGSLNFSIEHFNFGTTHQWSSQNVYALTAGYSLKLNQLLTVMISGRAENISSTYSRGWSLRTGILGGNYETINDKGLFYETYYESYLQSLTNPYVKNKLFGMTSAWIKFGWRWNQIIPPLFFDPIIIEGRIYRNNSPTLAGDDYSLVNIGPRLMLYKSDPTFSISLFGGRSFGIDSQTKKSAEPFWFLLSFGGHF